MPTLIFAYCLVLLAIQSAYAGIYQNHGDMNASWTRAKDYMEKVYPGKIVIANQSETEFLDFASAVPIGQPGEKQTTTILSCAHTFIQSLDYEVKLFYHDFEGNVYDVEKTSLPEGKMSSIPDASQDIALYHLKKATSCNPLMEIEKTPLSFQPLMTLSSGWVISFDDPKGTLSNLKGEDTYFMEGTFHYNTVGTYESELTADRVVSLFDGYTHDFSYLARIEGQHVPHQTYFHDSGSAWFTHQSAQDISLTALSSRFTPVVTDTPEETTNFIESMISEHSFDALEMSYTLSVLKLQCEKKFKTILTCLAPHRDWIYKNISYSPLA